MPKVHNIGAKHFLQVTNFPFEWGNKVVVRGWTQEIEEPFRTSKPVIVRLPKYKALVFGRWTGQTDEEHALNLAVQRRDVTYDDFTEEAGWTPAPDADREKGGNNFHPRLNNVDGAVDVYDRQTSDSMATSSE